MCNKPKADGYPSSIEAPSRQSHSTRDGAPIGDRKLLRDGKFGQIEIWICQFSNGFNSHTKTKHGKITSRIPKCTNQVSSKTIQTFIFSAIALLYKRAAILRNLQESLSDIFHLSRPWEERVWYKFLNASSLQSEFNLSLKCGEPALLSLNAGVFFFFMRLKYYNSLKA